MPLPFIEAYIPDEDLDTENSVDLGNLYQNSYIGNTLLNILGSYWYDHYEDMDNLHLLAGSITALIGTEYQTILQQVISSSIVDTPVKQAVPYQLFSFNSKDAKYVYTLEGALERIEFAYPGLEGAEFLSSGLLDSSVVLQRGEHFSIDNGILSFYVDIFNDSYINANAYVYTTSDLSPNPIKVVLLWASDVCMEDTFLYDRYGRYLYTEQSNSLAYKATLVALQYFFTTTKSVKNLEVILNILFNLPFAKTSGEVVTQIVTVDQLGIETTSLIDFNANARAETQEGVTGVGWFHKITTTHNVYFAPVYAEMLVGVEDALSNYQLICRVHRAKDYITDPDWYNDARFPFELVEELADYTVLNTPPEFEPYVPHHYDSSVSCSGDSFYTGEYASYNGINPFLGTRSNPVGTEFEQVLYGLVDTVLKHNLLYVQTELNYDNIEYYQNNRISESYAAIAQGVPTYLYPVMETLFNFELVDQLPDAIEDVSMVLEFGNSDLSSGAVDYVPMGMGPFYDGEKYFSNLIVFTHNATGTYGSAFEVPFYPYGGPGGVLHNGRIEIESVSYNIMDSETFPAPVLNKVYDHYTGYILADGSALFTEKSENEEPLDIAFNLLQQDMVPQVTDTSSVSTYLEYEEYVVLGYTGAVGYSNTSPVTYGSTFLDTLEYDETLLWDGVAYFKGYTEKVGAAPTKFNGVGNHLGYDEVKYTYGASLPEGIQVLDELGASQLGFRLEDEVNLNCVDLIDVSIGMLSEDTVSPPEESSVVSVETTFEEYATVGHTGDIGYSNVTKATYGSEFLTNLKHDELNVWDGEVDYTGYKVNDITAISFNGNAKYRGYTDMLHTYGASLPEGIWVEDSLDVVWTQI